MELDFEAFHTYKNSLQSVLRLSIGDIDFDQFEGSRKKDVAVYVMLFYGIVTLYILFSMFFSIIDSAYNDVKEWIALEAEEKKLISKVRVEYFGDRWYKWWKTQIKKRSDQGIDQIKRRVTTTSSSSSDKKIVPSN